MSKYALISFTPVNPGTNDTRYYVYGHEYYGKGDRLAICKDRLEAMQKAFEFRGQAPVWEGRGYESVLEKLSS